MSGKAESGKRLGAVWLALSAITLLQLWIGAGDGRATPTAGSVAALGAVGVALVKVRIIFREFMDVRHAPALLGRLTDLWIVLTAAILLAAHLAGKALASD